MPLVNDLALLRLAAPIAAPALTLLSDLLPVGIYSPPLAVTIATGSNQAPRGCAFAELAEVIAHADLGTVALPNDQPVRWLVTYNAGKTAPYVQGGDSGGGLFWGQVTDSTGSLLMGITSAQFTFDTGQFGSGFVQLAACWQAAAPSAAAPAEAAEAGVRAAACRRRSPDRSARRWVSRPAARR